MIDYVVGDEKVRERIRRLEVGQGWSRIII